MTKKSTTERRNKFREKMRANQYKKLNTWLDPETAKTITDLMEKENLTQAQAIQKLIKK